MDDAKDLHRIVNGSARQYFWGFKTVPAPQLAEGKRTAVEKPPFIQLKQPIHQIRVLNWAHRGRMMNAEAYGKFLASQGMASVRAGEHLWVEKQRLCLESIPPHKPIRVDPSDSLRLFLRGYLVLRYTCDELEGVPSKEFVCEDREYSLDSLDSKARNKVRQGLKNCTVRPLNFAELRRDGCAINQSVFERQGRAGPAFLRDQTRWEHYLSCCEKTPDVWAYGAFVGPDLCAYTLIVQVDDYAYTYHPFAHSASLAFRPMNALIFSVTKQLLQTPGIRRVSYGLESLVAQPALEEFKAGMGFQGAPIGRRIQLNPLARPLLSSQVVGLIRRLEGRFKGIPLLENYLAFAEGHRKFLV